MRVPVEFDSINSPSKAFSDRCESLGELVSSHGQVATPQDSIKLQDLSEF
jgi:hypothetical protein